MFLTDKSEFKFMSLILQALANFQNGILTKVEKSQKNHSDINNNNNNNNNDDDDDDDDDDDNDNNGIVVVPFRHLLPVHLLEFSEHQLLEIIVLNATQSIEFGTDSEIDYNWHAIQRKC